jgi:hypothetical protein
MLIGAMLVAAIAASPAGAGQRDAKPKIISARVLGSPNAAVLLRVVARDSDDAVYGLEVRWGDGHRAKRYLFCGKDKRGKRADLRIPYVYAAAGDYTVKVRALSGGCAMIKQQQSSVRRLHVHVR